MLDLLRPSIRYRRHLYLRKSPCKAHGFCRTVSFSLPYLQYTKDGCPCQALFCCIFATCCVKTTTYRAVLGGFPLGGRVSVASSPKSRPKAWKTGQELTKERHKKTFVSYADRKLFFRSIPRILVTTSIRLGVCTRTAP